MICQLPKEDNSGVFCMRRFELQLKAQQLGELSIVTYVTIGDYVRHLIAEHWSQLVKIHEAMESGEIPRET